MPTLKTKQDLKNHLQTFHKKNPFSDYIQEIVYGGVDGIVTTMAVVSGFFGANSANFNLSVTVVILFGLSNLFADGASMGLGNFLSQRANNSLYLSQKKLETKEIEENPDSESDEITFFLKNEGFNAKDSENMAKIISKNKPYWVKFMMEHELDMHDQTNDNNALKGFITFMSFILFGFLPLIPFLFLGDFFNQNQLFIYSVGFSAFALVLLGYSRSLITLENKVKAISETVLVGSISGLIAFLIGTLI